MEGREVAAILPAYNEEKRIGSVLAVLRDVPDLTDIVVVDDGSADHTAEIVRAAMARDPRVRLLQHEHNRGKGEAIYTGRQAIRAPLILLLDCDLIDLQPHHVQDLIRPVASGQVDMTLGLFWGGEIIGDLSHMAMPWQTGQRCLTIGLLDSVNWEAARGYGFEMALTVAALERRARTLEVRLHGVWHPHAETHRWPYGLTWRLRMQYQMLQGWTKAGGWQALWRSLLQGGRTTRVLFGERIGREGQLRVGCSAAIFDPAGERILLTRRADNGQWCLPGGAMEPGEDAIEACQREVLEETGLQVRVKRLIGVYSNRDALVEYPDGNRYQIVVLHFEAEVVAGTPTLSKETTEIGYFTLAEAEGMDLIGHQVQRVRDSFAARGEVFLR